MKTSRLLRVDLAVMVSFRSVRPASLLFLLVMTGVVSQQLCTQHHYVCAVRGSTVTLGWTYTYPFVYNVCSTTTSCDLFTDPQYSNRVHCTVQSPNCCRVTLSDVTIQDQGTYHCKTATTDRYVHLSVTELQVEMVPESVVEGGEVILTCKSTCSLTNAPIFTWYKNGCYLYSLYWSDRLHLRSVRQADAGSYSCAVQRQSYRSPAVTLNVHYPPKRVSASVFVSISPPGGIVEGDVVTLTCSSDANPPVETFTWYKDNLFIRTGKNYIIIRVSSEHSGEYKCKSSNRYGEKYSDRAVLNVLCKGFIATDIQLSNCVLLKYSYTSVLLSFFTDAPKSVSVSISPPGEIVEGGVVTLTCSSDANPPVETYTWYKDTSFVGTGTPYTINRVSSEHRGEYKCKSSNQYGEKYSDGSTLNVLYPPKSVSVSISPSGEIVEGGVVTLMCSSDANPPVETYTWYLGESYKGTEKTHTIMKISSEDSGDYKCKSSNRYGEKYSDKVTVNVLYAPKSVSVSISPLGEIVEGGVVTLMCSSDANPPVETYTWYKDTSFVGTGTPYTINRVSSEHSGEYKCKSSNQYGEKYSDGSTLNVLYPPKSVSVSISPSGEIVEGGVVTLTCSSDANPPVETYTWYLGESYKGTEKTHTIMKISSEDSGDYKCKSSNRYGEKYSDKVTVNVLYAPKSVSVSISPSGEIVEGGVVTLTCSSDANPPVETYTWYKDTFFVGTGTPYTINRVSSEHSGEYKCKSSNQYGEKYSDGSTLNVLYPPKSVSVSISPSGEIVEGGVVTLTCSSDANPPVETYTWYLGESYKGTEKTHTIMEISSEDSGDYKCKSSNRYGEKYSDKVTVNVLYAPKSVSVSISPLGEIVEGGVVTLTCSSDANPPVETYTWYLGESYKGTEKNHTIMEISSEDSGDYKCKSSNRYGEKYSDKVTVNVLCKCSIARPTGILSRCSVACG
ncbi:sialoadhesin [Ictalurus punctatus]|uniref:Sialoadhesin n=1 Tax=Ictalurus punctatus TaxID=7998 RepID=A0A9F7TGC0_ICTPU|nr:sialoadhesin [Ictalurus punctatus]